MILATFLLFAVRFSFDLFGRLEVFCRFDHLRQWWESRTVMRQRCNSYQRLVNIGVDAQGWTQTNATHDTSTSLSLLTPAVLIAKAILVRVLEELSINATSYLSKRRLRVSSFGKRRTC
jgi:hypothetical protein